MADIVRVHHPKVEQTLIDEAIAGSIGSEPCQTSAKHRPPVS